MNLGGYIYLYDEFDNELEHAKYWEVADRKKIMEVWVRNHGELASYYHIFPKVVNGVLFQSEYNKQRKLQLRARINAATGK